MKDMATFLRAVYCSFGSSRCYPYEKNLQTNPTVDADACKGDARGSP